MTLAKVLKQRPHQPRTHVMLSGSGLLDHWLCDFGQGAQLHCAYPRQTVKWDDRQSPTL